MYKFLLLCSLALCFALTGVATNASAQDPDANNPLIWQPDRGPFQFGLGYQYQHFDVFKRGFNTNGYNVDVNAHLFDAVTGADGRLTVALEGTGAFGFGGQTTGTPSLNAKSLFLGGGPHIAIENRGRIEPWIHGLIGWEHLRFTQAPVLGSNSALGYMLGAGLDLRVGKQIYWRIQADYLGTHYQSDLQSNWSVGTGLMFNF
jgi:hypothetical protein